jgi:hypothetical protein
MSTHFTPEGPYTLGGNFDHTNANNIEDGIEAVDNAKPDIGTGNMATAFTFIVVGPDATALPAAGVANRIAFVVPYTPS